MELFLLYLFTRLDPMHGALCFLTVAPIFVGMGSLIGFSCAADFAHSVDERANLHLWRKRLVLLSVVVFFAAGIFKVLLPTQKDLAIIVGGYLAIQAASSEPAKKVYSIVNGLLDEQLAELEAAQKQKKRK